MTDTRRTLEILAVALVITLAAVWAIGRAGDGATAERVRAEMRDSVAYEVAVAIAPLRRAKEEADSARLAMKAKLAKVRQSARVTLDVTGRTVDSLRTVPATDTTALPMALAAYDSLAASFRAYLRSDSTAHALTDSARVADHALIAQQDRALVAMTQARDAWRQAADAEANARRRGAMRIALCAATGAGAGGVTGSAINGTQGAALGAAGGALLGAVVCR